ncbi:MAG: amidohydrolase [Candidatus Dormibacteria bacterium]
MKTPPVAREMLVRAERIHALDDAGTIGDHLAIRGGRALAVGGAEVAALVGPGATRLDLPGLCVLPGFDDAHCHPVYEGLSEAGADLRDCRNLDEVGRRMREAAGATPGWVTGRGLPPLVMAEHPSADHLEAWIPGRPAFIDTADGHLRIANHTALAAAGIDATTPDPAGGTIGRTPAGGLDGVLGETAMRLVVAVMPPPALAARMDAVARVADRMLRLGITTFGAVVNRGFADDLRCFRLLQAAGRLRQRVVAMLSVDQLDAALEAGIRTGLGDQRLSIGAVKVFVDGSMPALTAATRHYLSPDARPSWRTTGDELQDLALRAHPAGLQLAFHAVGEMAVEAVAAAFEQLGPAAGVERMRHRVEHCSLCPPPLAARLGRLGMVGVMQPGFLAPGAGGGQWLDPDAMTMLLPLRTLARAGVTLALSSDSPVTPDPDPWVAVSGAVAHLGPGSGEGLELTDALRAHTLGGARASHQEGWRGTLAAGRVADFCAWPLDPFRAGPAALRGRRPEVVAIGGQVIEPAAALS